MQIHLVVFFNKSTLANSFGEWILENIYVLPTDMQGAFRISTKGCIGPVPAFETLRMDFPNALSAAFFTSDTKDSEELVRAAASP
jgi:hypothetical protein